MFNPSFTKLSSKVSDVASGKTSINSMADDLLDGLVKATANEGEFGGFAISFTEEEALHLKSQFSTEVLDDGSNITQYRVKEPIRFKVSGYVVDVFQKQSKLNEIKQKLNYSISTIDTYTNGAFAKGNQFVAEYSSLVQGGISYLDRAIQDGNNIAQTLGFIDNVGVKNTKKQFDELMSLWNSSKELDVSIFGKTFQMRIESVQIRRKSSLEKGRLFVDIEFVETRIVKTMFATLTKKQYNSALAPQRSSVANKGLSKGTEEDVSLLFNKTKFLRK